MSVREGRRQEFSSVLLRPRYAQGPFFSHRNMVFGKRLDLRRRSKIPGKQKARIA